MNVKSIKNDKTLEFIYEFDAPVKKYGFLKYIETMPFGGSGFKAELLSEKGVTILDKKVWDEVSGALLKCKGRKL